VKEIIKDSFGIFIPARIPAQQGKVCSQLSHFRHDDRLVLFCYSLSDNLESSRVLLPLLSHASLFSDIVVSKTIVVVAIAHIDQREGRPM
jgi:hypothetical protein